MERNYVSERVYWTKLSDILYKVDRIGPSYHGIALYTYCDGVLSLYTPSPIYEIY